MAHVAEPGSITGQSMAVANESKDARRQVCRLVSSSPSLFHGVSMKWVDAPMATEFTRDLQTEIRI